MTSLSHTLFQSTHPRGVRLRHREERGRGGGISIHAPTWGATREPEPLPHHQEHFNPRTHVGCDRRLTTSGGCASYFNPRTHVGCDADAILERSRNRISIHAPTWGATGAVKWRPRQESISIHAPTWGATQACRRKNDGNLISIHAPTWGATDLLRQTSFDVEFQSTHPRGVRQRRPTMEERGQAISIHAPTWGATSRGLVA